MDNINIKADGTGSFVAAGEPAWHMLGTLYGDRDGITVDQALEDIGAGEIVTSPLAGTFMGPDGLPGEYTMPGVKGTFRSRPDGTLTPLGVVGHNYKIIQEHEGWRFLYELIGMTGAYVSAAGLLGNGARSFLALKLPEVIRVGGLDAVDQYLFCDTSHDGKVKYTVGGTLIRVVCQNTLNMARAGTPRKYEVAHTVNAKLDPVKAREALGVVTTYAGQWRADAEELFSVPVTRDQFHKLVTGLYGPGDEPTKASLRAWETRVNKLDTLWKADSNAALPDNAWKAFNVFDEYLDWGIQTRGVPADQANARRFEQALSGDRDATKRQFADALVGTFA